MEATRHRADTITGTTSRRWRGASELCFSHRSPAVGIFSDTLHGLTATRAFRGEAKAEGALLDALDRNARSWFWWLLSQRYLGFYLDAICVTFLACLLVATILLRNHHQPQILALALLYAVQLAGTFQWTVRQHALAESFMASVAVWKSNLRRLTPSTRHIAFVTASAQWLEILRHRRDIVPVAHNLTYWLISTQVRGKTGRVRRHAGRI